jgi:hypothetical protein
MYFVDVRPFDRRYTQSQQGGGGGGGGGGGEQGEISQRQREILVSTWNLLRRRNGGDADQGLVKDNAELLSTLQKKLAEQTHSLTQRSQARELVQADQQIGSFVQDMTKAAEAMGPAAQHLAAIDLEAAIQPEQQALQYLLRAEAQYKDIQVALQRDGAGGGGSGNPANDDLQQMFELEMDLQKNRYETGSSASPQSQQRDDADLARRLQDLARRQEKLASAVQHQRELTPEQRWQQESLRREAEDLRRELAQQRAAEQGASSASGRSGQSGQGGQPGAAGAAADTAVAQRLDEAVRAMDQARTAMDGSGGEAAAERARRAEADAQRQLAGANSELARAREQAIQASIAEMAARAGRMYDRQAATDTQVQNALRAAANRKSDSAAAGLDIAQQARLADDKRDLGMQLQRLQGDIATAARRYRNDAPEAAHALEQAGRDLQESDLQGRLTIAAQFIEQGRAAYVAASESAVTDGMRGLRDQLQHAASLAGARTAAPADPIANALARVQNLREEVQGLANANLQRAPGAAQSGRGPQGAGGGPLTDAALPRAGLDGDLRDVARGVESIRGFLRERGMSARDVQAMSNLAQQLSLVGVSGRGEELARELSDGAELLEQLEVQLARADRPGSTSSVRAAVSEPVTEEYKEAVAEYYRQLSGASSR